jgi:hypothetical protein
MDEKEWNSYRLMKWDYESTIWWRGTLLGLEKMTHPEVQATEECTSRKVKKSGMDNWFIAFLLVGLLFGMSNKGTKVQSIGILGTVGLGILYLFDNNSLTTGAAMAVAPLVVGTIKDKVMNKIMAIQSEIKLLKTTKREAIQRVSLAEGELQFRFFGKAEANGVSIKAEDLEKLRDKTKLNYFFKWNEEGSWVRKTNSLITMDQIDGMTQEESHRMIAGLTREELVADVEEATKVYFDSLRLQVEMEDELKALQNEDMESYVETLHGLHDIYGTMHENKTEFYSRFRTEKAIAESEADDCEF